MTNNVRDTNSYRTRSEREEEKNGCEIRMFVSGIEEVKVDSKSADMIPTSANGLTPILIQKPMRI